MDQFLGSRLICFLSSCSPALVSASREKVEAMMSDELDLEVEGSRFIETHKKARQRDRQKELVGASFKIMICILVLMEVPWTMIGAIALAYMKRLAKSRSKPDWPSDKIKRLAREGLALMPTVVNIIDDSSHRRIQNARKWLAECKLAMWCLQHNQKGIAVPTSIAINHYVSLWGMGPHVEKVSRHLNQFSHFRRRSNWMQRFKRVWDFDLAICGRASSLSADEIANKVHRIVEPTLHPDQKKTQIV